jgi:hypothetical protein
MILERQQSLLENFTEKMKETILKKGNDYAGQERMSNFLKVAEIAGLSPEQVILTHLGTKVARLSNLLNNNKTPENEAVEDTLLDLANYAFLMVCALEEKETITYRDGQNAISWKTTQPQTGKGLKM